MTLKRCRTVRVAADPCSYTRRGLVLDSVHIELGDWMAFRPFSRPCFGVDQVLGWSTHFNDDIQASASHCQLYLAYPLQSTSL